MSTSKHLEPNNVAKQYYKKLMDAGYYKEYYQTKLKQAVVCECGHCVTKANLTRHKKTKAHNQIMKHRQDMTENTASKESTHSQRQHIDQ